MKHIKKIAAFIMVLVMVLIFSSCTLPQSFENDDLRTYTDQMLNSIITNDKDSAYSLVSDICTESQFNSTFEDMRNLIDGVETYELKLVSIYHNTSYSNGESISTIDSAYVMQTEKEKYVITVQSHSQYQKLSSFYITPYEKTNLYYTGVIKNMRGASIAQWLMLLSNLIIVALVIIAFIDCCRHKVKLKALWIILIILGVLAFGLTVSSTGVKFNFNFIWITAYNAIVRYGNGTVVARIILPFGAIVYLILRRWLIKKSVADLQEQPETTEDAQITE